MTAPEKSFPETTEVFGAEAVELAEFRRIKAMAATGTAENFLACDDDTKRLVFALLVEESQRRKEAEQVLELAASVAPDAAQLLDVIKGEWEPEGCWSEWDQSVRDRLTGVMVAIAKASGAAQ